MFIFDCSAKALLNSRFGNPYIKKWTNFHSTSVKIVCPSGNLKVFNEKVFKCPIYEVNWNYTCCPVLDPSYNFIICSALLNNFTEKELYQFTFTFPFSFYRSFAQRNFIQSIEVNIIRGIKCLWVIPLKCYGAELFYNTILL